MTTQEFVDYCLSLAAQTATDPNVASVLDASIVVEFILPFVLREATRRAWKQPNAPQPLVRAHAITITNGFGVLPAGVEEEFAKSFEVGLRVADLGSYAATGTWTFVSNPASGAAIVVNGVTFTFIDGASTTTDVHIGATPADTAANFASVLNASTDPAISRVTYVASTTTVVGTFDVDGSVGNSFTMAASSQAPLPPDNLVAVATSETEITLTYDAATGDLADAAITVSGGTFTGGSDDQEFITDELGLWSLYEHYGDFVREEDDLLPRFCVRDTKIFVDRDGGVADGTVIVLYGVTLPQVPTNPDAAIPAPESLMDDCMVMVANVLKGDAPLSSIGVTKEAQKMAA